MMQMRTHTCNELRASDAGKSVKIVGWMENVREVGGSLAFVVLRDFYGTTRCTVPLGKADSSAAVRWASRMADTSVVVMTITWSAMHAAIWKP